MRLIVFIAKSGYTSRRKADLLIKDGRVKVNGRVEKEPFFDVSAADKVEVGKKRITLKEFIYIVLHKPKGVASTVKDKYALKTVLDCLPKRLRGVYPVGRLDKNSTGLIVLTNDGDLCFKATHPKFSIEKEYLVGLRGLLTAKDIRKAYQGIKDEGELLRVKKIDILRKEKDTTLCRVIVCEGKKRHIRRIFRQLGFSVFSLKRVRIGKLILGNLAQGRFKLLPKAKAYSLLVDIN
jgi:23S rRNA pseudouridine2605 synthase